jgi:hypothetical protein
LDEIKKIQPFPRYYLQESPRHLPSQEGTQMAGNVQSSAHDPERQGSKLVWKFGQLWQCEQEHCREKVLTLVSKFFIFSKCLWVSIWISRDIFFKHSAWVLFFVVYLKLNLHYYRNWCRVLHCWQLQ